MGIIDNIASRYETNAPQFTNLWEFYLEDWNELSVVGNSASYSITRFDVEDTSLLIPFSLTTDNYVTGKNYYTGVTFPDTFSITVRENTSFSAYNYFDKWLAKIYDIKKGYFISSPEPKTKTGTLRFTSFKLKESSFNIFSKQYVAQKLKNLQTIASQTMIQQAKKEANKNLPYPMSMVASQAGSFLSAKTQSVLNSTFPMNFGDLFEEVETAVFSIENIRILGMEDISLSYGDSDQLRIVANFVADRVIKVK